MLTDSTVFFWNPSLRTSWTSKVTTSGIQLRIGPWSINWSQLSQPLVVVPRYIQLLFVSVFFSLLWWGKATRVYINRNCGNIQTAGDKISSIKYDMLNVHENLLYFILSLYSLSKFVFMENLRVNRCLVSSAWTQPCIIQFWLLQLE